MTDEPDKANIRFSEPMKIRHPGRVARAFEQMRDFLRFLEFVEQTADPVEIFCGAGVDQVRVAAHDQHRTPRMVLRSTPRAPMRPARAAAASTAPCRSRISARSRASASASVRPGQARVDEVADLGQRGGAGPVEQRRYPVLDTAVERRQAPRARGCCSVGRSSAGAAVSSRFGARTTPAAWLKPRKRRRRRRQRILDRLVANDLPLDLAALARRPAPRPA